MSDVNNVVVEPKSLKGKRGSNSFSFSAERLLKVLNLQSNENPNEDQIMTASFAESIAYNDNAKMQLKFVKLLEELEISLQSDETIGINRHTITTFGNHAVTLQDVIDIQKMREYLFINLWAGLADCKEFVMETIEDNFIEVAYENYLKIAQRTKINGFWRVHRIVINGLVDEKGTVGSHILYRVENSGERSEQIIKTALHHLAGYGKYILSADDSNIGVNFEETNNESEDNDN